MRFSVITCTYNRSKQLADTIESLCQQAYNINSFELLIIDNNSTDDTPEIAKTFIEKHSHISISYHKELSQGLSFALNRGIQEAKGEYIVFIDDDETIEQSYLNKLDSFLLKRSEVVYAASIVSPIYEGGEPQWMSPYTQRLIGGYFYEGKEVKELGKSKYPGTGHTIIKRELYSRFGLYNTELGRKGTGLLGAEDKDMAHRLIGAGIKCYYLPITVCHHIPSYKLSDDFFSKVTYSIGKSERIRTRSISSIAFMKRILSETIKWGASFILWFFYAITFRISKGNKLLIFRWNVTKGLLGY